MEVRQNRTEDENFNIEKRTLLIRNGSNAKVWFTGSQDQTILMAYEAPAGSNSSDGNSLFIMQYSNLEAMQ